MNDREIPRQNSHQDDAATGAANGQLERAGSKFRLFGREYALPRSRLVRIILGSLLVIFGIFGFLPVLGFWMIPLGLLILSYEFSAVRRWRRRFDVWWGRRRASKL